MKKRGFLHHRAHGRLDVAVDEFMFDVRIEDGAKICCRSVSICSHRDAPLRVLCGSHDVCDRDDVSRCNVNK